LPDRKGSVEAGKDADLAVFKAKDYREIAYWIAGETCAGVIANGVLIDSEKQSAIGFE